MIGGSIGLAIKKTKGQGVRVIGFPHREETIAQALMLGAVDEGTLDLSQIATADIVFIATPLNKIIHALKESIPHLKKGVIVTDVGSSKYEIVKEAQSLMPKGTFFVGGHPMAGKEKAKLVSAEAELFIGRSWILTETTRTSKKAIETLTSLIAEMGSSVLIMDPKLHDLAVAGVSHMPLAISAALVNAVAFSKDGVEEMKKCASSGFRDTTRIASGDPELGVGMFTTNKKAVLKMIKGFKNSLSQLESAIKANNPDQILAFLQKAKEFRDGVFQG